MKETNNLKNYLLIISLVLIVGSLFIYSYTSTRLISMLAGIVLLLAFILTTKQKIAIKLTSIILVLAIIFGLDTIMSHAKIHEPILAWEVKSNQKIKTFNSILYRVYSCNNKLTFDYLYKKDYPCNTQDLNEIQINSFLNNIDQNYQKYNNKFIKITGKVSQISGSNIIEMASYEVTEDSINGHVAFGNNLNLKVYFNSNLTKIYKIYDNVTVIGRITKIKKQNDKYTIEMQDSTIKETDLYNDYQIVINENPDCDNNLTNYINNDNLVIQNYCLQNIYIKYDDANVYDLSYVLLDKKLDLNDLLAKKKNLVDNYDQLYEYENFNILQCKENNQYIIGNKNLGFENNFCPKDNLINPNEASAE